MLPVLGRAEAREFDQHAMTALHVSGAILMENAGRAATDVLIARFGASLERVVLVGGLGQNGGDAWVVARHLLARGYQPRCVVLGEPEGIEGDALPNFTALESLGIPVTQVVSEDDSVAVLTAAMGDASLVVDGIFGTGLTRPVTGIHRAAIDVINRTSAPVMALDLPSGVHADTGQVLGGAIAAQATATFGAYKRGLTQYPGRGLSGYVQVCDLGVPGPVASVQPSTVCSLMTDKGVRELVQPRVGDTHKGKAGRVLVVAGGGGTTGAALLSGLGALHAGAGLVTLAPRLDAIVSLQQRVLEMMTTRVQSEDAAGYLTAAQGQDAVVVGPGFGLDDTARLTMLTLATDLPQPAVLDADALTALADAGLSTVAAAAGPRVLTPHPGEAGRLLGVSTSDIQADRFGAAAALAEGSGQVVVLKGAGTVVAAPGGQLSVTLAGTPAMAGAGMGDVLSGALAAFLCASRPYRAACIAVHTHGRAGERASAGDRGLLASDLAAALPAVLAEVCG